MSHASFKDIERDVDADDGRSVTDGDVPSSRNRRRSRPPSRYSSQHFGHESYDAYDLEESAEYDGGVKPARTVDEKHDALNAMFGFKPWKSMDKPFYDPSSNLKPVSPAGPSLQKKSSVPKCEYISYVIWLFLGGLWISLAYFIAAGLLYLTIVGRRYGPVCVTLAKYYFWPFNSFIIRENDFGSEKVGIVGGSKSAAKSSCSAGYVFWAIFTWPIATVVHSLSFIICWMSVVFIPMAKVNQVALGLLFEKHPEDLQVIKEYPGPGADVLLCTFSASNINYYRYTVGGMNIVLVNLLPFVFLCLIFSYLPYLVPSMELPSTVMFTLCSLSVIPCSYYIGTALSSFSAQTNFALGALLNATFGSLIEIILYTLGIAQGTLNDLVQAAVTGTILAMLLLLPGLSMIVGGIKHTQQRFNPAVAGVSSVLLLLAVIGAFTPTIFYQIYGHYTLSCDSCTPVAINATTLDCNDCLWKEVDMETDPVFINAARPLMYACAGILPISYIVGLIFTLKTHAHILEDPDIAAEEEAPIGDRWSKTRCIIILLLSTFLYSLIAEELVNTLEPTIELLGISQTFAGLTMLAVIPSVAEFANGISFALNNNFALSLEIGNSAAVQVVLIQMPVLIVISVFFAHGGKEAFTLIFPALDVLAVVFAVIIVNYISIDGKANYFLGSALVISYTLIVVAFYFVPDISPDSLTYTATSLNPLHQ